MKDDMVVMWWMWAMGSAHKFLIAKPEAKESFGRPRSR
jgi:hypothetical protein